MGCKHVTLSVTGKCISHSATVNRSLHCLLNCSFGFSVKHMNPSWLIPHRIVDDSCRRSEQHHRSKIDKCLHIVMCVVVFALVCRKNSYVPMTSRKKVLSLYLHFSTLFRVSRSLKNHNLQLFPVSTKMWYDLFF